MKGEDVFQYANKLRMALLHISEKVTRQGRAGKVTDKTSAEFRPSGYVKYGWGLTFRNALIEGHR